MNCFRLQLVLGLLALSLEGQADSTEAAAWFAPPQWRLPTLAPNGRFVAALAAPEPLTTLWILPTEGAETPRSVRIPSPGESVADLVWSGSDELAVLTLNEGGGGGFWMIRRSDGEARPLLPPAGTSFVRLLHPQPQTPGTVWIEGLDGIHAPRKPKGRWLDLLAVATATGRVTRSFRNPGDVVQWFVDGSGNPRLTVAIRGDRQELRLPDGARHGTGWRTATSFDAVRDPASVLALARDGSKAWVSARLGRDTIGVYELDLSAGRFTQPLVVEERFDIGGQLLLAGNSPVAQSWHRLMPHTAWFDPRWEKTARQLATGDENGNGTTGTTHWVPVDLASDGRRAVFEVHSDRSPPRFAVVSPDAPSTIRWMIPASPESVPIGVPRTPVEFIARDGQIVTAYVTHPDGTSTRPTVVLVHGGPWTRDVWGWSPEAQFFAARGWTVLQVNYRGSAGFGRQFQEAAAGRWTDLPTSDLVDAVHQVVNKGSADSKNVALTGASFGGYLTLTVLAAAPDLFQAGVSVGGAFNLPAWLDFTEQRQAPFVVDTQRWRLLGSSPKNRWSSKTLLETLRRPLLLLHAADDAVVPLSQSDALSRLALTMDLLVPLEVLPAGGHTLESPVVQAAVWSRVEKFLSRHTQDDTSPK